MYVCNCDTFKTIVFATNKQITVHNFQVDIFGECSARSCKRGETACEPNVAAIYKFYLSFENSFCSEYVTEKFYNYMAKDIVPVVLGIPIPSTTTYRQAYEKRQCFCCFCLLFFRQCQLQLPRTAQVPH